MICHGSIFLPRYEFPGFPGNKEVTDKRAPVQARRRSRRLASGAAPLHHYYFLIFNFSDEEKKQSTRITLTLTLDNAQQLLVDPE